VHHSTKNKKHHLCIKNAGAVLFLCCKKKKGVENADTADCTDFKKKGVSLYGSARLGEYSLPKRNPKTGEIIGIETEITGEDPKKAAASSAVLYKMRGFVHYELTNHLGNVLAVVTDRKLISTNAFYVADVLTLTDYYAFGQAITERTYNAAAYKYGYNGKEKDNELYGEGNAYDFGARINDPRLGRWLSLDPLAGMYPSTSPYAFVRNSPIVLVDPNGEWDIEVHVYNDRAKYGYGIAIVKDIDGNEVFRFIVRVEGSGSGKRNRMNQNADTPLGVYDIPNKDMWITPSAEDRKSYGPNPRLILVEQSGEIIKSGRTLIRFHGGQQEKWVKQKGKKGGRWEPIDDAELKNTNGCLRVYDADMIELKRVTDELLQNNAKEKGGVVTITDDLVKQGSSYNLPDEIETSKEVPVIFIPKSEPTSNPAETIPTNSPAETNPSPQPSSARPPKPPVPRPCHRF
jgi:RHS repeat-associated protein